MTAESSSSTTVRASGRGLAALAWTRTNELLPRGDDWREMRRQPLRDAIAGVTVATVALPLALAFGLSSGLTAQAGLVTAVVAGVVAAVFGGSSLQVSGPTGAMAVVLVPIVAQYGPGGVLTVGLIAGVVLHGLAYARAGRFMRFVPLRVSEGFTVGIAIIIGLQQVPAILGVEGSGEKVASIAATSVVEWVRSPVWLPVLVAGAVAAAMLVTARVRPRVPMSLIAVVVVTVIASVRDWPIATIGAIPASLPTPALPPFVGSTVGALLLPAIAVAALAALESLLSATVADAMSVDSRHNPDRELFGQGMANLVSPLFGGMPATAAIARTAVNVRTGARSRLAAIMCGVALLLVMVVAARWVSLIPLAALAGVLIATCVQMVEVSSVRALLRSTRGDAAVLVLTAVATVAFDLVTAVLLGLLASGFHALQQMAKSARLDEEPLDDSPYTDEEAHLLADHVVAFRLDGPLFFGAAHTFLLELTEVSDVRVVILRMSRLQALDATGAAVLADTIKSLEHRHITVLLSGTRDQHRRVLTELGVFAELAHERHVFVTTPEAIEHARRHVTADHE